jgi:hypothetical protein
MLSDDSWAGAKWRTASLAKLRPGVQQDYP